MKLSPRRLLRTRHNRSGGQTSHMFSQGHSRRQKEELEDSALALSLSDSGKKDDIYNRIMKEFEENPDWKSEPHFEGLFNLCQKHACLGDLVGYAPTAGSSNPQPVTSHYPFTFSYPPVCTLVVHNQMF